MRIIVFFDLPTKTKAHRKDYQLFRKFLLNDGYDMIQYSVYSRVCNNLESADKHVKRLEKYLPSKGSVRAIIITEKQYSKMKLLVGSPTSQEKILKSTQLLLF